MGDVDKDLEDIAKNATEDFYELLGVAFDAQEAAVKKAYRKASIKYHPDKNPDNKDAANRFIYLGWARDILLDATLKGIYDRSRTRRREKVLQDELLDGRRRTMKQDLERREREGKDFTQNLKRKRAEDMSEAEKREQEIQRLAEDGKRRRKEAQERLNQRRKDEDEASFIELSKSPEPQAPQPGQTSEIDRTVKIRFQRDADTQFWDKDKLQGIFAKYGKIDSVVMGKDKKVRPSGEKHRKITAVAFIIYTRVDHAHAAISDAIQDHPNLEAVSWASGSAPAMQAPSAPSTPVGKTFRGSFGGAGPAKTPSLQETTMMRLKEAEKKRLEEQIRRQEAAEEAAV
ncbi:DnaJ-domain-containing protein [Ophiobolus disseminans]|uniref:DnaJ-domain-containing protein n=1 Tax=Ophiobolus disseminans TaxID=1469910 RepID=A0A6A6ZYZ1_9PLEO|nr:DnaJ-domain-containing protein [Ophiobolus disseminans]